MTARICKNPTCTRHTQHHGGRGREPTYCSRACQLAMRTRNHGKALPDIWVGMDQYHDIAAAAERENMTIREWVIDTLIVEAFAIVHETDDEVDR